MTGSLLPVELLEEMTAPYLLSDRPLPGRPWQSTGYGLGLMIAAWTAQEESLVIRVVVRQVYARSITFLTCGSPAQLRHSPKLKMKALPSSRPFALLAWHVVTFATQNSPLASFRRVRKIKHHRSQKMRQPLKLSLRLNVDEIGRDLQPLASPDPRHPFGVHPPTSFCSIAVIRR